MKKFIYFQICLYFSYLSVFAQFTNEYKSQKPIYKNSQLNIANKNQQNLMDKYDVNFYKIDIGVERTSVFVTGNVLINAKVLTVPLDTFVFELKDYFVIDSIKVNAQKKNFFRVSDIVYVPVNNLNSNTILSAQIFYYGMPLNTGNFFSGISNQTSSAWGNQITWTLSEPFAAKEWFPVKQSLNDKADSAYIFVTTSSDNKVGSNGLLTAIVPLSNNKVRYEWKTHYPIAYYLLSIAVGKYLDYSIYAHPSSIQDSVLIQNYIYDNPSVLNNYKSQIDTTIDFIELYSDLFGIYPFYKEKYGHSLTPLAGGMEHQTMTTIGNFNFYLTCHELSHQWWGDNVTCATWSDIWINEGFASYAEYLAADYLAGHNEAQQHMLEMHNYVMSSPDGSVYIPPYQALDENRIFDGRLSYKKGAAIIHNLRFEINNDSIFFNVLKTVQDRFKDSVMTGLDFKAVTEDLSGKDFTDFFNQWYFGEGYPTFDIVYWQLNDTLFLNVNQTTSIASTPLFKMKMEYKIQWATGDTLINLYHSANTELFKIPLKKTVTGLVVDPNNWVVNGYGFVDGISNPENIIFKIFPNPCKDYVQIYMANTENKNYILSVFDLVGKVIFTSNFSKSDSLNINLSYLKKGIYFLQIRSGNKKTVQKFIKN